VGGFFSSTNGVFERGSSDDYETSPLVVDLCDAFSNTPFCGSNLSKIILLNYWLAGGSCERKFGSTLAWF
jgi:hypothetical protein